MSLVENHYNFNSVIISKVFINFLGGFPKIKKLSFFFIINLKQYKKNLLLFYIMISLIFGGILVLKKKEVQGLQVFKITIKKKKIWKILSVFINFYLPLLNVVDNSLKKGFSNFAMKKHAFFLYRMNFFSFPVISELDVIYLDYEMIYDFISCYRVQLDVYIKIMLLSKDSGEFLLSLLRFPCKFYLKKKIC